MLSSKQKKVHYERGTKGGKSSLGHRSSESRDSGVGSESASDRASVGTSPGRDAPFSNLDIQDQRSRPWAVQEALDAASEKIGQLEAANIQLKDLLTDSNKENRALKRERMELLNKVDYLMDDLKTATKNSKSKGESSPRTGVTARKEPKAADSRRYRDDRTPESHGERRQTWREMPVPLYDERPATAPQPPLNTAPNPFMPNSTRPGSVSGPYAASAVYASAPTTVTYAPPMTYPTAPASSPRSPLDRHSKEDGFYHHYPLR